ncbi:MAG: phosphoadenylyl-sulfate reductase [Bacteroidetes bacterium]|nr:phosphoadenylyl-sulfate reductase [Bacteroidota bacterium]
MNDAINQYVNDLAAASPAGAIEYFNKLFPSQCIFSTSLGPEDQVLTEIIATSFPSIRIFTLDTGRLFQDTYELLHITQQKYDTKIEVFFPDSSLVENMVNSKGINLFYDSVENRRECCSVRKIIPLSRALKGMKVWITGLRREQSEARSRVRVVDFDQTQSIIKLNTLIDWKEDDLWSAILAKKIPYNGLQDK